jgi:hypothetical protein
MLKKSEDSRPTRTGTETFQELAARGTCLNRAHSGARFYELAIFGNSSYVVSCDEFSSSVVFVVCIARIPFATFIDSGTAGWTRYGKHPATGIGRASHRPRFGDAYNNRQL